MTDPEFHITAPKPARRRRDVSGFGPVSMGPELDEQRELIAQWSAEAEAMVVATEPVQLTIELPTAPDPEDLVSADLLDDDRYGSFSAGQVVDVTIILPDNE